VLTEHLPICTDCKHAKLNPPNGLPMACFHPLSPRDLVTGAVSKCREMREPFGPCSTAGVLFEQRPIAPPRLPVSERATRFVRRIFQC
jgi:hypothetical protein